MLCLLLLWICWTGNAQNGSYVVHVLDIDITESSCDEEAIGKIVLSAQADIPGKLMYNLVYSAHYGQADELTYTSESGVFEDLPPGRYTIHACIDDMEECSEPWTIILSQKSSTGNVLVDDVADHYCDKTLQGSSITIKATETSEQPVEWFALMNASSFKVLQYDETNIVHDVDNHTASCTFNNVSDGNYMVKAGNHTSGCALLTDGSITVKSAQPVVVNVNTTDVACAGESTGEINVAATGGKTAFSYVLLNMDNSPSYNISGVTSGIFTDLSAGAWHVLIEDATECTLTISDIVVHEPENALTFLTINQTKFDDCNLDNNGGTVVVEAGGGSGGYEYKIDNGVFSGTNIFEHIQTGLHQIFVRDIHRCEHSTDVEIMKSQSPDLSASEVSKIVCYLDKGTVTINAVPFHIEGMDNEITAYWLKGDFIQETDHTPRNEFKGLDGNSNYTLFAEDSYGCVGQKTVFIPEPESPLVLTLKLDETVRPDGNSNNGSITVTASGGWEGYTVVFSKIVFPLQWDIEKLYDVPAGDITFNGLDAGEYKILIIEDREGCTKSFPLVWNLETKEGTTGTLELDALPLKIFPNPSDNGQFTIEYTGTGNHHVTLEIFNASGLLVNKTSTKIENSVCTTIDLCTQPSGIYLLYIPEWNITKKLILK